jgi:hypothetical protein
MRNDIILDSSIFAGKVMPTSLQQASDLLERGDWQSAHVIAQEDDSRLGSWAHGIVHVLEGDLDNARYWYRRAGREFPQALDLSGELRALRLALASERGKL